MSFAVRKLFVDSRFAVSGDSSSFEYELPEVVELPHDAVCFVTEFTTVASWDTVSEQQSVLRRGEHQLSLQRPYSDDSSGSL